MKNFQEKITFEIDKNRFGIFVAAFRAAAPQCLFGRANINKAGPIFGGAQSFNGENQFWRKAGEIPTAHFLTGDGPAAALDNDTPATEPRCLRRQPELEWMKPKRNDPIAGKRTEILTTRAKGDVAIFRDENFSLRWRNGVPARITALRRSEDCLLWQGIENPHRSMRGKISGEETEMKKWFTASTRLKSTGKNSVIGATPVHTMMQGGGVRVQLAHDPAIFASRNRVQ